MTRYKNSTIKGVQESNITINLNRTLDSNSIMSYKYEQPTEQFVSVYEYFESKGYEVKITDVDDGTIIFIKEKK